MDDAAPVFDTRDVLSALAHKLGSPLGALVNHAHLLRSGAGAPAQLAGDMDAAARRASTYLAGARRWLQALERTGPPGAVDVGELARAAAESDGVDLDLGPVPPVLAVPAAMAILLAELVRNAREAAGAGAARIRLAGVAVGSRVRLAIGDPGAPWSRDEGTRAFALFTSLRSGSNGAGMGLPIVSALARAQGGWAKAATDARDGTRIHLDLPAVR